MSGTVTQSQSSSVSINGNNINHWRLASQEIVANSLN